MNDEAKDKLMTTRQLARRWGVGEATVKRWADAGHVSFTRTLGGHRRFTPAEVERFERGRALLAPSPAPEPLGNVARSSATAASFAIETAGVSGVDEEFFAAVVAGEDAAASALLLEHFLDGEPLARVLDGAVAGTMRRIGDLWHAGEMSVAEEHLATRAAVRALERLGSSVRRRYVRGAAMCCALEEDLHEVSTFCVQVLLESAGWAVKNYGGNTPLYALAQMVERERPQLVCLSGMMRGAADRAAREYRQFYETARACGARVALGGAAFQGGAARRQFPADLYAENLQDLADFLTHQHDPHEVAEDSNSPRTSRREANAAR